MTAYNHHHHHGAGLLAGLAATFALWVLDIATSLARALLRRRCRCNGSGADAYDAAGPTARQVLHDKFGKWREAFGDITWSSYRTEVSETFQRATTLRRSTHSFRNVSRSISKLFVRSDSRSSRFSDDAQGGPAHTSKPAPAAGGGGGQPASRPSTIAEQDSVQSSPNHSGPLKTCVPGSHPIPGTRQ